MGEHMKVNYSQDANERVQRIDLIHPSMVDLAIHNQKEAAGAQAWTGSLLTSLSSSGS